MSYYRKLIGERLYLSPINPEDAETYTRWLNDLETTLNLQLATKVISLGREKDLLDEMQRDGFNFAIVLKENDELIGNCGLLNTDLVQKTSEFGIFIGEKKHRGQGYGTEAIRLLLDFAFNLLNLHSVYLRVRSFNEAGQQCYRKIGFKEIGRRRECVLVSGTYYDEIYMDILADEFEGNITVR